MNISAFVQESGSWLNVVTNVTATVEEIVAQLCEESNPKLDPARFTLQLCFTSDLSSKEVLRDYLPALSTTCSVKCILLEKVHEGDEPDLKRNDMEEYLAAFFQERKKDDQELHVGIICDGCGMDPMVGERWKCEMCTDSFDLCQSCYSQAEVLHKGHPFSRMQILTQAELLFQLQDLRPSLDHVAAIQRRIILALERIESMLSSLRVCGQFSLKWVHRYRSAKHLLGVKIMPPKFEYFLGVPFLDVKRVVLDCIQSFNNSFFAMGSGPSMAAGDFNVESFLKDTDPKFAFEAGFTLHQGDLVFVSISNALFETFQEGQHRCSESKSFSGLLKKLLDTIDLCIEDLDKISFLDIDNSIDLDPRAWFYIGRYIFRDLTPRSFLSHRGPSLKSELVDLLEYTGGRNLCFLDRFGMAFGQSGRRFILENLIKSSDALFFVTPDFWESPYCQEEVKAWSVVTKIRHILERQRDHDRQLSPSSRTEIWAIPEARNDLSKLCACLPGIPVKIVPKEAMLKMLLPHLKDWYPQVEVNSGLSDDRMVGMLGNLGQSAQEMLSWNSGKCSLYALLSVTLQTYQTFEKLRQTTMVSGLDVMKINKGEDKINDALLQEVIQLETFVVSSFENLHSVTSSAHDSFSNVFVEEGMTSLESPLSLLVENCQLFLEYSVDLAFELMVALCSEEGALGVIPTFVHQRAYALSLSLVICAMERLRDAFNIMCGKMKPVSCLAGMFVESDKMLESHHLEFNILLSIDLCCDARSLAEDINDVVSIIHLIGGESWTAEQWKDLTIGIQEQCRMHRRGIFHSGASDKAVFDLTAVRDIVYIAKGEHRSFFDGVVLLFYLLHLNSRSVVITQSKEDESGLKCKVGSLLLEDLPHFTLETERDIWWMFLKPKEFIKLIHELGEGGLPREAVSRAFHDFSSKKIQDLSQVSQKTGLSIEEIEMVYKKFEGLHDELQSRDPEFKIRVRVDEE